MVSCTWAPILPRRLTSIKSMGHSPRLAPASCRLPIEEGREALAIHVDRMERREARRGRV